MNKTLLEYIKNQEKSRVEHSVYGVPIVIKDSLESNEWDIGDFITQFKDIVPGHLLEDVEIIYVGEFPNLEDKNALYVDGAIYVTNREPTVYDMLENIVHELAHSLEERHSGAIYTLKLEKEFLAKRLKLKEVLDRSGYEFPEKYYLIVDYTDEFDMFLSETVGYPVLLALTIGLFLSPYGATSLREYFANGLEKYYLDGPQTVAQISPALYQIIEKLHFEREE